MIYSYGTGDTTARNHAIISWEPMSATGFNVYEDDDCIATLDAGVTGYEVASPLGHDYQVQALYGDKFSRLSDNAVVVSHNPWLARWDVDTLVPDAAFALSQSSPGWSILLDPEATEVGVAGGKYH